MLLTCGTIPLVGQMDALKSFKQGTDMNVQESGTGDVSRSFVRESKGAMCRLSQLGEGASVVQCQAPSPV